MKIELSNPYMAVYPFVHKLYRNKCKPVRNKDGKVVQCVLRVTGKWEPQCGYVTPGCNSLASHKTKLQDKFRKSSPCLFPSAEQGRM